MENYLLISLLFTPDFRVNSFFFRILLQLLTSTEMQIFFDGMTEKNERNDDGKVTKACNSKENIKWGDCVPHLYILLF